jgi:hypothetical protein
VSLLSNTCSFNLRESFEGDDATDLYESARVSHLIVPCRQLAPKENIRAVHAGQLTSSTLLPSGPRIKRAIPLSRTQSVTFQHAAEQHPPTSHNTGSAREQRPGI